MSTDLSFNGRTIDESERTRQPSSRLDMDAVRREKMFSLKKTRAGHLGYLNKLYKDVELLMQNTENHHEACDKKKDVEIAFARCFQAYDEYYQFVDDPAMKSEALNACFSVMSGKKKSSTNVSQNGLKQFNGSRVKAQWFLVKKMVLTSKHNTSHVR